MEFTTQTLAQRLVDLNLVPQHRVEQLWSEMRRGAEDELEEFKSLILRKELVTNFQLDRLLTGERLGFFYGPYKVLYLIGAGLSRGVSSRSQEYAASRRYQGFAKTTSK